MAGAGWKFVSGVAALARNPLILDFMVAARGYGIALGLWMWALALLIEELSAKEPARRKLAIAGAGLALSVTASVASRRQRADGRYGSGSPRRLPLPQRCSSWWRRLRTFAPNTSTPGRARWGKAFLAWRHRRCSIPVRYAATHGAC